MNIHIKNEKDNHIILHGGNCRMHSRYLLLGING